MKYNEKTTIDILGTIYNIFFLKEEEDKKLVDCDGYTDVCLKKIVIGKMVEDETTMGNLKYYEHKILRHEILHAFLFESGLRENSVSSNAWARNEEMVDWFAIQFPKILLAYEKLGIEKGE